MVFSAILCDRDGVLIDSEDANITASTEALHNMGITSQKQDEMLIMGKHPHDYANHLAQKYDINMLEFLQLRNAIYEREIMNVQANEDVCEFILSMRQKDMSIALVTSASRDNTVQLLHRLKLKALFDILITFDECANRKPHPAPYRRAAHDLGVHPQHCLVLEDSPTGLIAAKKAGMICVIRRNPRTCHYDFSGADLVVDDMRKITQFFSELSKKRKDKRRKDK